MGLSDFRISGQPLINKNCHNSKTSNDIDVKLRPVTKIDRRKTARSKQEQKIYDFMSAIVTSLLFFFIYSQFEALPVKLTFSLIASFYLTKTENRTKKSVAELSYYCFG